MGTVKRFRTDDVWAEILCTMIGKSFSDIIRDRHFGDKEATQANHNIERHFRQVQCRVWGGQAARFMVTIPSNVSINPPFDYQSYISVRWCTTPLLGCSTDICFLVRDAPCLCGRSRSFPRPSNDLDLTKCGNWLVFCRRAAGVGCVCMMWKNRSKPTVKRLQKLPLKLSREQPCERGVLTMMQLVLM
jgi:hypothetical protein